MQLNAFVRISKWFMISYCLCLLWLFFFLFKHAVPSKVLHHIQISVGGEWQCSIRRTSGCNTTHTYTQFIHKPECMKDRTGFCCCCFFYPFHVFRLINRDIYWAQAQVSDISAEDLGSPSSQHAPTLHHCLEFLDDQFAIFDILFFGFCFFQAWIDLTLHGESRWNSKTLKQWHDE